MPHGHALANARAVVAMIHMNNSAVLNIAFGADADRPNVAAQNAP